MLQKDLEHIKETEAALRKQLDAEKEAAATVQAQLNRFEAIVKDKDESIKLLQEEVKGARANFEKGEAVLHEQLKNAQTSVERLEMDNARTLEELRLNHQKLASAEAALEDLHRRGERAQADAAERLESQIDDARSREQEAERRMENLREEVKNLRQDLTNVEANRAAARQTIAMLKAQQAQSAEREAVRPVLASCPSLPLCALAPRIAQSPTSYQHLF